MDVPSEYTPTYIPLEALPIAIEEEYSAENKREALYQAEGKFELDRNGGEQIPTEDLTSVHKTAVANLATYHLVRGAVGNSDVTLGDLGDDGDQRENHAEQFLEVYNEALDALAESGGDNQPGTFWGASGNSGGSYTANTGRDSRRHDLGEQRPFSARQTVHEDFVYGDR